MSSRPNFAWILFLGLSFATAGSTREPWSDPTEEWGTLGPPNGTLLIHGGSHGGKGADAFLDLIGDLNARIVVIPTAGSDTNCGPDAPAALVLSERGAKNVVVLHTRERKVANSPEFSAPLRDAVGVWISGGVQSRLAKAYLHTRTHTELFRVLERGGVVAGNSAGASIQGSYLYGGHAAGDIGFGFVRNSVFGQHYIRRHRMGSVQRIVTQAPELLGVGLDEGAFIIVRRDQFEVSGNSKVAVCDAHRPGWPGNEPYELLFPGDLYDMQDRRILAATTWNPEDQWEDADNAIERRMAAEDSMGPVQGKLLLTGDQPDLALARQFLDLIGKRNPRIVVIPNFNGKMSDEHCEELALLNEAGAKNTIVWHTIDRRAANSIQFVAPLTEADAVWICQGEQWKLADAYRMTLAHEELFRLLDRGGTIAASGGGARFLADQMAGDRYGWNRGAGFLRNTVVHTWSRQNRQIDAMKAILLKDPAPLGIGIDDQTAILVQGNVFEVVGAGKVAVFDATRHGWPWQDADEACILLGNGERYDMIQRRPDW